MESVNLSAVVFQGGGAFGSYEYGAFKALWDRGIRPRIVTGVSIGAVNAAVIAGCKNDNPPVALDELWDRLSAIPMPGLPDGLHHLLSMPFNPGMYYPNPGLFISPFTQTYFSDTRLLERTLNEMIDWEKLNQGTTRLAVTSLNIETGKLEVFANFSQDGDQSQPTMLNASHILASGALPPGFPMVQINGSHYWDGGLFDNTPLKPAFKALNAFKDSPKQKYTRSIYVFSLFPQRGMVPKTLLEVEDRKMSISFECKVDYDQKLYQKMNSFREFAHKVDAVLPRDSPLRNDEGFTDLLSYEPFSPPIIIELTEKYSLKEQVLMPGTDFTHKTIKHRCDVGYQITMETLDGKK